MYVSVYLLICAAFQSGLYVIHLKCCQRGVLQETLHSAAVEENNRNNSTAQDGANVDKESTRQRFFPQLPASLKSSHRCVTLPEHTPRPQQQQNPHIW